MISLRSFTLGLAATALSASVLFAASHEAENPAVKARQAVMTLYAFNLGTLGAMAQEKMPYDANTAAMAAKNLAALSHLDISAMWPADTDNFSIDGTRALPDLWANFPDVGAKAQALQVAADAMAAAAGTDLASLQAAMGPLGGACGDCHKAYRASE